MTSSPAILKNLESTPRGGGANWSVQLEGLGKRYQLGKLRKPEESIRAVVVERLKSLTALGEASDRLTDFWAIRDINLEIERGETVGIIGRNGAGKSTMLKLLSRITAPTTGVMRYRGRLASLLEVGTGFHRELTGRENIFLNGSILGMARADIQRQFDAIVDFSNVDQFLDTPVKHYSSGMYIRLAFAVAAHLRTDILVVDEVLAVGDAQFQKKCLGKMQEAATDGRTVLFVSHNMEAVSRLCRTAVLLKAGQLEFVGPVGDGISRYLASNATQAELQDRGANADCAVRIRNARVMTPQGKSTGSIPFGQPATLEIEYDINRPVENVHVYLRIHDEQERVVLLTGDRDCTLATDARKPGSYRARLQLPTDVLNVGSYTLAIGAGVPWGEVIDLESSALVFDLVDQHDAPRLYLQRRPGIIRRDIAWETENL